MGCHKPGTMLEVARKALDIEIQGLEAVRDQLDGGFTRAVDAMAACTGRVVITGVGKSGLVGRKIAATLSSTGTPSFFLHPVEGAHGDMGMIRDEDVVLAISNSGNTDEVNAILPTLKSLGATVISLTGNEQSTMAELSDIHILAKVPREACPIGLAPTASTTAHLAVGDALAVCLMEIKAFSQKDFKRFHPGGSLGQRLSMCVDELMHTEKLPVVDAGTPLRDALEVLHRGGFGLVAIVENDCRLLGVLTDGDVRRSVITGELDPQRPVDGVMTPSPRSVSVGESAACVLDLMEIHQITVLPVVGDDGCLAGIVHLHDLLGKGKLKFSNGM
ncbi:KpsF/GutQ family sugar-phosphate isomerase [Salidesulfovibrio onnuriiensis]|uniref:KpsF/GutQ family sugar-phosphate isomerase n=1 Tax=Salidesulfovibrio onnuriiensis TaxID=2583823 RepID=UPI0011CA1C7F|nr:KpsF/GutQ family sugar-phosphate isomerase [Salidesulfovibrio onnuriiensis]